MLGLWASTATGSCCVGLHTIRMRFRASISLLVFLGLCALSTQAALASCLFGGEVKAHEQHREMRTEDITSENPGMIFSNDSSECGKDNFPRLPNSSECTTVDEDIQRLTTAQTRLQTATTKKKKKHTRASRVL